MKFAHRRIERVLEVKPDSRQRAAIVIVGAHNGETQIRTEKCDPEPGARAAMPTARRFTVDIYAGQVDESDGADVERDDQGNFASGTRSSLVPNSDASPSYLWRCSVRSDRDPPMKAASKKRKLSEQFFSANLECEHRAREYGSSQMDRRDTAYFLVSGFWP
jgi:hypothetical protein